jgi:hypothetical protein
MRRTQVLGYGYAFGPWLREVVMHMYILWLDLRTQRSIAMIMRNVESFIFNSLEDQHVSISYYPTS